MSKGNKVKPLEDIKRDLDKLMAQAEYAFMWQDVRIAIRKDIIEITKGVIKQWLRIKS